MGGCFASLFLYSLKVASYLQIVQFWQASFLLLAVLGVWLFLHLQPQPLFTFGFGDGRGGYIIENVYSDVDG